jgi:phage-related protein
MYGGTKEEMQRLLADAQKLTGIKYDITSLNDVFQAIHVIQENLEITGTTAKEAEDTISGSISSMKSAWDNFLNGSGTFDQFLETAKTVFDNIAKAAAELLPRIAKEIIDAIPDEIVNTMEELKNKVIEIIPYAEALGVVFLSWKIGTIIQNAVKGFQEAKLALSLYSLQAKGASIAQGLFNGTLTLGETLVGLLTGKVTLAQIATAGLSKAQAMLNAVMSANPITLIVIAIGALIAIFIVLWNNCESFRNFWINLWDNIKKIVSGAIDNIKKTFNKIISFVKSNWQGLLLLFVNPFAGAFKLLYDNCEGFRNFINNFIENVKNFFINGWNSIVSFFTETIPQWIQTVIIWIQQLPYNIGVLIGQIIGNIINFGVSIWNWITVDLPQIIQGIVEWFAQLPGRIWECLLNIINSVIEWGTNVYNTATEWISNTINSIVDWFVRLPGRIWTCLTNVINKVKDWGRNLAEKGRTASLDLVNNIIDKVKELPGKMLDTGKNIVEGLWNGIKNAKEWIKQKVGEFAKSILDGMKSALGIHSPSKLFKDEVGRFIPQGVAVGIEADTESALRAIDNMNDDIISEMNKAVAYETGSINAKASVKSNNSMLNVIQASISLDGSVEIDGQKAGKLMTPYITKTLRTGGAT